MVVRAAALAHPHGTRPRHLIIVLQNANEIPVRFGPLLSIIVPPERCTALA
jgi:hypothetical protein